MHGMKDQLFSVIAYKSFADTAINKKQELSKSSTNITYHRLHHALEEFEKEFSKHTIDE